MHTSLPTDSTERKTYPLFNGLFGYFGAALTAVAHHSWKNNEKHNPGEPLHWSMDKSSDHADCCMRHLIDIGDIQGMLARMGKSPDAEERELVITSLLEEADANAWRALALSQSLRVRYGRAPVPFNATTAMFDPVPQQPVDPRGPTAAEAAREDTRGWTPGCDATEGPCRCGATHS